MAQPKISSTQLSLGNLDKIDEQILTAQSTSVTFSGLDLNASPYTSYILEASIYHQPDSDVGSEQIGVSFQSFGTTTDGSLVIDGVSVATAVTASVIGRVPLNGALYVVSNMTVILPVNFDPTIVTTSVATGVNPPTIENQSCSAYTTRNSAPFYDNITEVQVKVLADWFFDVGSKFTLYGGISS